MTAEDVSTVMSGYVVRNSFRVNELNHISVCVFVRVIALFVYCWLLVPCVRVVVLTREAVRPGYATPFRNASDLVSWVIAP